jgi:hypothetical protein
MLGQTWNGIPQPEALPCQYTEWNLSEPILRVYRGAESFYLEAGYWHILLMHRASGTERQVYKLGTSCLVGVQSC